MRCKVYTDARRWYKIVKTCLFTYTKDNPLAKARGLSPRTGGQAMV